MVRCSSVSSSFLKQMKQMKPSPKHQPILPNTETGSGGGANGHRRNSHDFFFHFTPSLLPLPICHNRNPLKQKRIQTTGRQESTDARMSQKTQSIGAQCYIYQDDRMGISANNPISIQSGRSILKSASNTGQSQNVVSAPQVALCGSEKLVVSHIGQ
jgi:hypothetical protein